MNQTFVLRVLLHTVPILAVHCLAGAAPLGANLVDNGSFEADGGDIREVGYISQGNPISEWKASMTQGVARNTRGIAFFDNGVAPDGENVAIIQNRNDLQQLVDGFEAGRVYRFTIHATGRAADAPDFGGLRVRLNATTLLEQDHVPAVGEGAPFHTFQSDFTIGDGAYLLVIEQTNTANGVSILIDDVRIEAVAAPASPGDVIAVNPAHADKPGEPVIEAGLTDVMWVWTPEAGNPREAVPVATRYFRREVELPAPAQLDRVFMVFTADNRAELFLNGTRVAWADRWDQTYTAELLDYCRAGTNALAIAATNEGEEPNAAGLVGQLVVTYADGRSPRVEPIDATWRCAHEAEQGWNEVGFDDGEWYPPVMIAPFGDPPWGWVGPPSRRVSRYFPDFQIPGHEREAALLREMFAMHYGGCVPLATMWDQWLAHCGLWPVTDTPQTAGHRREHWSNGLLGRRIDDEGYVSTHQHIGLAHSEGWPFPMWTQSQGMGWHFSTAFYPKNWGIPETRTIAHFDVSGWRVDARDEVFGMRMTSEAPRASLETPQMDVAMIVAPFIRITWGLGARPEGAAAYLEWKSRFHRRFSPDRRVAIALPPDDAPLHESNIKLYTQSRYNIEDRLTGLRLVLEGAAGTTMVLNRIHTAVDTRHNINGSNYAQGCADYFVWTGDLEFLREAAPRVRRGLRFTMREFNTRKARVIDTRSWVGHDGRSGQYFDENGEKLMRTGVGVGNNYWDLLPFGGYDSLATWYYYDAIRRWAAIETQIAAHPEWGIPTDPEPFDADDLRAHARQVRDRARELFWDADKGRFVANVDVNGRTHDYGYTFVNLEAIYHGIASREQAESILAWISGERIIEGETSTGADIYHWRFAPRASTVRNLEWYGWVWRPEHIAWGDQVQDGGAVLGWSYHDIMARLKTRGPDDAWARVRGICDWFEQVQREGGYRIYYSVAGRGSLQGGGTAGGLGMDQEFFESALVPQVLLYGFMGLQPHVDGLSIDPRLPSDWSSITITRIAFQELKLDATVARERVEISVWEGTPARGQWLELPGSWTAQIRGTRVPALASPQGRTRFALPEWPARLVATRGE